MGVIEMLQPFVRKRIITPSDLGLNAVTLVNGSTNTSNTFSLAGANQLVLAFALTRVAATAVSAYLEYELDGLWIRQQASAVSSGAETLSDHIVSKAVTGNKNWWHNFGGVLADNARIVIGNTSGSTDTLKVWAIPGVV